MSKIFLILSISIYWVSSTTYAQAVDHRQQEIDSLELVLYRSEVPKERITALRKLAILHSSDTAKSLEFNRRAWEIAETHNLKREISLIASDMGHTFMMNGMPEAKRYLELSLKISEEINDVKDAILTIYSLALYYKDLGDYEQSIAQSERAIAMAEADEDQYFLGGLYVGCGMCHQEFGNYAEALRYYHLALNFKRVNEDAFITTANTIHNIGTLYFDMGMLEEAEECLFDALEIAEEEDPTLKPYVYKKLGFVFNEKEPRDFLKALEYGSRALTIFENERDAKRIAESEVLLGNIYLQEGSYDSARFFYKQAEATLQNTPLLLTLLEQKIGFAKYLAMMDSLDEARKLLEKWLFEAESIKAVSFATEILQDLYELEKAAGNFESALSYFERKKLIEDSLSQVRLDQRIELINTEVEYSTAEIGLEDPSDVKMKINWYVLLLGIVVIALVAVFVRNRPTRTS